MHLAPRDLDKLVLHGAGVVAQKRLARGLRLNYPEAIALIATTAEGGTRTVRVKMRVADGEEREQIWERQKAAAPGFAEYETNAAPRQIPVVVLDPVA